MLIFAKWVGIATNNSRGKRTFIWLVNNESVVISVRLSPMLEVVDSNLF